MSRSAPQYITPLDSREAGEGDTEPSVANDLFQLTKPRIVLMVAITASAGFLLGVLGSGAAAWGGLAAFGLCLIGTSLAAGSANALNMVIERGVDAHMDRTRSRPVASGRVPVPLGWFFGIAIGLLGCAVLLLVNSAASVIALATIVLYAAVYTPLKRISPWSLHIGAVPGALPPVIGWVSAAPAGATGWAQAGDAAPWLLFFILAAWQIPHVVAIAVRHREDYARAGIRFLPVIDDEGRDTARCAMLWSLALVAAAALPVLLMRDVVSGFYALLAVPIAATMLIASVKLARTRTADAAKRLFLSSLLCLPLLLASLVTDSLFTSFLR